jgi:maltose O-acetyltransferase
MYQIANRMPKKIKSFLIEQFLKRENVQFDGIPSLNGPWIEINNKGNLLIGVGCSFRSFRLRQTITVRHNAKLIIGNNSFLNDGINICATQLIQIGHNAKIGDMTFIYDTDFHQISPEIPIKQIPVSIGNNVWIGANSMILPGAVIGNHSVIAAGSIVSSEIPPKSLAMGSPAKPVKTLNVPDNWIRK